LAIAKAPTYGFTGAGSLGGWDYPSKPPAKQAVVPPPTPSIGYTGSGWNYPSSSLGGSIVNYPTAPGASPSIVAPATSFGQLPSSGPPAGSSNLPANSTPPNLDLGAYLGEMTSDPVYQQGLASYQSAQQANTNNLGAALKNAIIQGGWTPDQVNLSKYGTPGGTDLTGLIDQSTYDAAQANQMSDRAQLQTQLNRGLADVPSQLAARGATRSGAANIASANLQNQYDVAANSAMQNLAQAISGNVNQYGINQQNALYGWNQTQADVANRLAAIATAQAQAAYSDPGQQQQPLGQTPSATVAAATRAKAAVSRPPTALEAAFPQTPKLARPIGW
jgi:hypothetical protein